MILSDMFVLRNYSSPDAWKPGELLVGTYSSEIRARGRETHEALQRGATASSIPTGPSVRGPRNGGPTSASITPLATGTPSGHRPNGTSGNGPANSLSQLLNDPILASLVSLFSLLKYPRGIDECFWYVAR